KPPTSPSPPATLPAGSREPPPPASRTTRSGRPSVRAGGDERQEAAQQLFGVGRVRRGPLELVEARRTRVRQIARIGCEPLEHVGLAHLRMELRAVDRLAREAERLVLDPVA